MGLFTGVVAIGALLMMYLFRERDPEALVNAYLPKRVKKRDEDEEEEEIVGEEEEEVVTVINGIDFGTASDDEDGAQTSEETGETEEPRTVEETGNSAEEK